ncbi:MAG: c-type cytochrome [Gemmataceae bacterium]|nr:c-type cytochrome [Gemmataceae bacterium]
MSRLAAGLLFVFTLTALAQDSPAAKPNWIWLGESAEAGQVVYFRKTFDLRDAKLYSGRLVAAADNAAEIAINGEVVLTNKSWKVPGHAGVSAKLRDGKNVITAKVTNTDGDKAGLLVRLELDKAFTQPVKIESDATWKVSPTAHEGWNTLAYDDKDWAAATVLGPVGTEPWAALTERIMNAIGRSQAAAATPAGKIRVKEGFKVELLYSVPRDDQGSWVSMCTDPRGRLIVSDQYGGLFRITPPPVGKTEPCLVEKLPIPLGEAQGLLWAFDSLYVVVNRHGKYKSGLWRVRASGDNFGEPELLRAIEGNGEHGPHAVLLHPSGKSLTVVCGNHTKLTPCDTSRVPRRWAEDQIIPRMWDAKGHAHGIYAPGGYVATCDPDGKSWQLDCMGFRNAYDAAYGPEGELFTFDSDMEWDVNTPWYRPTRVCHVVSGGEFGWRSGSGKWPTYYPDSLPPVVDIGPGSPTGLVFGTGAKFPAKYQHALYCSDWSYGKLYAVQLVPEGSSFRGVAEEFLSGLPLPLTDLVISPVDGAMYFAIGGRRTTSGLYRVTYVGAEPTAPAPCVWPQGELRELRRKLEAFHGVQSRDAVATVWPYLGHADRFIRHAARVALEHQDVTTWKDRAFAESSPAAALTALLAVCRYGVKDQLVPVLESLDRIAWDRLTVAQRLELLRVYALAVMRLGPPEPALADKITARFAPLFPKQSREVNIEIAKLLSALQYPGLAAVAVPHMHAAPTQEEQMDYANTLKSLRAGWTPELRRQYFEWFGRAAAYRGGNSFAGFCDMIRAEAAGTLSEAEREELKDLIKPKPRVAAAPPKPRPFVKKWTMEELVPMFDSALTGRDFERGRDLFSSTRCVACHRYDNDGGSNGPDLTGASGRFSVRDLLESMVEPSKVISDQYASVVITTADGKVTTGRIMNLTGDSIMLNTDMLDPNAITSVNRNLIESMETSKTSMMPDGLLDTCTADEVKDLIAYLLSKGDKSGPMFRK